MKHVLLLAALMQAPMTEPLVGRWDAEARSRGGLGTWMTLSADHTCAQTSGAMVDGTWQLTGDRLTRKVSEGPGASVHTEDLMITVSEGTLTMQVGPDKRQMTRVGQPSARGPALVGVWSYPHPAGGPAYEDFEPDGRYLFRLPISTTLGTWRADQTQLHLTVNQQTRSFNWSINAGRLTLEHAGMRDVFRREATGLPSSNR